MAHAMAPRVSRSPPFMMAQKRHSSNDPAWRKNEYTAKGMDSCTATVRPIFCEAVSGGMSSFKSSCTRLIFSLMTPVLAKPTNAWVISSRGNSSSGLHFTANETANACTAAPSIPTWWAWVTWAEAHACSYKSWDSWKKSPTGTMRMAAPFPSEPSPPNRSFAASG